MTPSAQSSAPTSSSANALEFLICQQIEELIHAEQRVGKVYSELANTTLPLSAAVCEAEMLELSRRADRLNRMIDAMAGGVSESPLVS
jgi:hypothetical protein